jgi:hypothetical protein
MNVHKIQIPAWLAQKLEMEMLEFPTKKAAVDALNEALMRNNYKFSIKAQGHRVRSCFLYFLVF